MKMEWTQSQFSLPFLDVHVSLDVAPGYLFRSSKVAITTRVYQKPMNAYLYIPWSSCHSDASKSSWVRGELIRYVRISSKVEDFEKIKTSFCKRLRARGYPGRWLRKVFLGVSYNAERPHALDPHPTDPAPSKTSGGDSRMYVLKLTHNPIWDDFTFGEIWRPLRDAWIETGLGRAEDRFLASFKKSSSLGDGLSASNRRIIEATQATPATEV